MERLTESQNAQFPMAVSPDGTRLVFYENAPNNASDLMLMPLQGERRPQPLVRTPFNEINGEISPDGRWLAYQSNESGQDEVFVRPFPNADDGRWQVFTGGGTRPLWARSGQELFYATPAGDALMSVPVSGTPVFSAGNPIKILNAQAYRTAVDAGRNYDVSRDGRRFLLIKPGTGAAEAPPAAITVVQNWTEELKRRVPPP